MSNRKCTKSNKQSTIFKIALKKQKNTRQGGFSNSNSESRLPSQTAKKGPRDGSPQGAGGKTSVPNSEKGPQGRKSARGRGVKLPSQMQRKGPRDGSPQGAGG